MHWESIVKIRQVTYADIYGEVFTRAMILRLVTADGDLTTMIRTATLNCSRATALTTTVQYENPEVDAAAE